MAQFDRLNQLEKRASAAEDSASEVRWQIADEIVRLLDSGLSQREVAAGWINPRTKNPYAASLVGRYAQAARLYTIEDRPTWTEAYYEVAPGSSAEGKRESNATLLPKNEQGLIDVLDRAARKLEEDYDRSPGEITNFLHTQARERRGPEKAKSVERETLTPAKLDKIHAQNALAELREVSETPSRGALVYLDQIMLEAQVRLESAEERV